MMDAHLMVLFLIGQLILQNAENRHVLIGADIYPVPLRFPVEIRLHAVCPDELFFPLFPLIFHADQPRSTHLLLYHGLLIPLLHLLPGIVLHDEWLEMPQVRVHLPCGLILIEILPLDEVMHPPIEDLLVDYALNSVQLGHANL